MLNFSFVKNLISNFIQYLINHFVILNKNIGQLPSNLNTSSISKRVTRQLCEL